jgi:hypothetical protein
MLYSERAGEVTIESRRRLVVPKGVGGDKTCGSPCVKEAGSRNEFQDRIFASGAKKGCRTGHRQRSLTG